MTVRKRWRAFAHLWWQTIIYLIRKNRTALLPLPKYTLILSPPVCQRGEGSWVGLGGWVWQTMGGQIVHVCTCWFVSSVKEASHVCSGAHSVNVENFAFYCALGCAQCGCVLCRVFSFSLSIPRCRSVASLIVCLRAAVDCMLVLCWRVGCEPHQQQQQQQKTVDIIREACTGLG